MGWISTFIFVLRLHDSPKQDEKVFKKGGGRMIGRIILNQKAIGQRRAARVHLLVDGTQQFVNADFAASFRVTFLTITAQ